LAGSTLNPVLRSPRSARENFDTNRRELKAGRSFRTAPAIFLAAIHHNPDVPCLHTMLKMIDGLPSQYGRFQTPKVTTSRLGPSKSREAVSRRRFVPDSPGLLRSRPPYSYGFARTLADPTNYLIPPLKTNPNLWPSIAAAPSEAFRGMTLGSAVTPPPVRCGKGCGRAGPR